MKFAKLTVLKLATALQMGHRLPVKHSFQVFHAVVSILIWMDMLNILVYSALCLKALYK